MHKQSTTWVLLVLAGLFSLGDMTLTDSICGVLVALAILSGLMSGVATGR